LVYSRSDKRFFPPPFVTCVIGNLNDRARFCSRNSGLLEIGRSLALPNTKILVREA
jgi:hypothetical protein